MTKRVHTNLDSFFEGIELRTRLARASELAAVGAFERAWEVLYQNGNSPRTSQEYDLLARISFHRGFDEDSRELWLNAQQASMSGISYTRELHILDELKKRKNHRLKVFKIIFIIWPFLLLLALIGNYTWDKYKKKTAQTALIDNQQKTEANKSTSKSTADTTNNLHQNQKTEQSAKTTTVKKGDNRSIKPQ